MEKRETERVERKEWETAGIEREKSESAEASMEEHYCS